MTLIKTRIIALALTASLGALATSAAAQTTRAERAAAREARAQVQSSYQVSSQRFVPAAGQWQSPQLPNQCRTDDGYGRFDTCDH